MSDQHFLSADASAEAVRPLRGGERVLWRGRCGIAEYAFEEAASMPRWTLPESTEVLVTDQRVLYTSLADDGARVRSGELRWLWPQHLRVQPGARSTDRGAAATQIQLVCGGPGETFPALVFAGGDLATVGDADRLANTMRQAVARFRLDNADKMGLGTGQSRLMSRLLIGPEFRNHQGGEGQTVTLMGAMPVSRALSAQDLSPAPPRQLGASTAPSSPVDVPTAPLPQRTRMEASVAAPPTPTAEAVDPLPKRIPGAAHPARRASRGPAAAALGSASAPPDPASLPRRTRGAADASPPTDRAGLSPVPGRTSGDSPTAAAPSQTSGPVPAALSPIPGWTSGGSSSAARRTQDGSPTAPAPSPTSRPALAGLSPIPGWPRARRSTAGPVQAGPSLIPGWSTAGPSSTDQSSVTPSPASGRATAGLSPDADRATADPASGPGRTPAELPRSAGRTTAGPSSGSGRTAAGFPPSADRTAADPAPGPGRTPAEFSPSADRTMAGPSAGTGRTAADPSAIADRLSADATTAPPTAGSAVEPWQTREPIRPSLEGTRLITYRPGMAADAARALMAAKAEENTQQTEPALASRAAEIAARVANLVAGTAGEPDQTQLLPPAESWSAKPQSAAGPPPAGVVSDDASRAGTRPPAMRSTGFRSTDDRSAGGRPTAEGWAADTHSVPETPGPDSLSERPRWRLSDTERAELEQAAMRQPLDPAWPLETQQTATSQPVDSPRAEFRVEEEETVLFAWPRTTQPGHNRTEHNEAERNRAERSGAEHNRAEGTRADHQAEDSRAVHHEAQDSRAVHHQAQDDKAVTKSADEADDDPTTNLSERAEIIRRTAARMTANSARTRSTSRRPDREPGVTSRGNRNG